MALEGLHLRADGTGLDDWRGGVIVGGRDFTAAELAVIASAPAAAAAADARNAAVSAARASLSVVLSLAAGYPYPTPEETSIVDAQAAAALTRYRALTDPPADVVSLAASVTAWRAIA
jgi:hypothetical protein